MTAPTDNSSQLRIAIQGEIGCNSEAAIYQLFSLLPEQYHPVPVPCQTFSAAFQSVVNQTAHLALIPFESSIGGTVHDNYDLIAQHNLRAIVELQYRVHHCLMVLPGVNPADITEIISHPQGLAQCTRYIEKHYPNAKQRQVYDTAGSAKIVSEQQLKTTACIAPALAAQIYGLNIVESNIEDDIAITRFLLLQPNTPTTSHSRRTSYATSPINKSSQSFFNDFTSTLSSSTIQLPNFDNLSAALYKTSIVFTLDNRPGSLHRALGVFAQRDLDLSKIESRPVKRITNLAGFELGTHRGNFHYIYFADILAHTSQQQLDRALSHLSELCPVVRILGSYPCLSTERDGPETCSSSWPAISGQIQINHNNTTQQQSQSTSSVNLSSIPTSERLRIGIIGFGTFGQFLAKTYVKQGHIVSAQSRSNYYSIANAIGLSSYTTDLQQYIASGNYDVLVIAVSILSFEDTIKSIDWSIVPTGTLVVDVCSVKVHPKQVLLKYIPSTLDILCTHPMFGPDSGKFSWQQLPFMYDTVRHTNKPRVTEQYIRIYQRAGCKLVELTCEEHDEYAAGSQFLTHTTGRLLNEMNCEPTPIDTKGYTVLRELIANTCADSFDLYAGLYRYNTYSHQQLDAFQAALDAVRQQLQASKVSTHSAAQNGTKQTDHSSKLNPRVLQMNESKTVAVTDLAMNLRRQGRDIISLSVGEPVDPAPQYVIDAAHKAQLEGKTKYTAVNGMHELRVAIAQKLERENQLKYTPEQIVVSNGAKQCIAQAVMALIASDEEVLIPAPYWVSYPDMVTLTGGKPVVVQTTAENDWLLTPQQLQDAITARTKMIILCTPNNPTGSVYSKQQLEALVQVLEQHPNVIILSDEIYEHLLYDGTTHTSLASLSSTLYERTLTVNGASKAYAMTGYRLGYIAGPQWMISAISKVQGQITSCASSISQHAFLAALTHIQESKDYITGMVQRMDMNRHITLDAIKQMKYAYSTTPKGAFYVMLDVSQYYGSTYIDSNNKTVTINNSESMGVYLLEKCNVALVPGAAFGNDATLRISFSADPTVLKRAMTQIVQGLSQLQPPNR